MANKCQSCGHTLHYNPTEQNLVCLQCGSSYSIAHKPCKGKKPLTDVTALKESKNQSYVLACNNCGAKSNLEEHEITTTCPYCGSNNSHEAADAIRFKPDSILPFAISKEKAKQQYINWIKTRWFVPNNLKRVAKINKIEGVYVPAYDFDFHTSTSYSGTGIRTHTRQVRVRTSNGYVTRTEHYTTRHPFSGSRNDVFEDELTSASKHITTAEVEELGNFHVVDLKVFSPEFLNGFISSNFEVDLKDAANETMKEVKQKVIYNIKQFHGFNHVENMRANTVTTKSLYRYVFLPIWICNFVYKKNTFKFLVNGKTGYVTGKVPRSVFKILALITGILAVVGGIGALIYL